LLKKVGKFFGRRIIISVHVRTQMPKSEEIPLPVHLNKKALKGCCPTLRHFRKPSRDFSYVFLVLPTN